MRLLLFMLICWLTLTTASAEDLSPQNIDKLIQASGTESLLQQIPNALRTSGQQQSGLGVGIAKPLLDALEQVFKPDAMLADIRAELIRQMDPTSLADAMGWFNSADAKAIFAAERRLSDPAVMEQIADAIETRNVTGLTEARKQLLQEVDNATGSTETALDMMLNIQAAFLTAFSHLLMPDQGNSFTSTLESFAGTRAQYQKLVQDQLLLQQAVVMTPVNDSALQNLRDFARSDSGQKTFKALRAALNHSVQNAATGIAAAMTQEEQARQQPTPVTQ